MGEFASKIRGRLRRARRGRRQGGAEVISICPKSGKVELSGYMVDKADIDALLEIAKKHAVD